MVQVRVDAGVLEGEVSQSEYGAAFYSFKGIPYAAPPLGDLRFKAPQPLKPWDGIRSARACGPICYQTSWTNKPNSGSEDCLYLNVYTPTLQPDTPLPVMFWIHGGSFQVGSGSDKFYGPEYLVRHDVILVTINYRLEVLGFLCLDTEEVPGNAGMKDQVAALKWVNRNISLFGGDPGNVTIFGNSSGAVCVTFHLVSPMSKGLFKRAIAQSGTSTSWAGMMTHSRERSLALARKLGCKSEDNKELHEFFQSLPVEKLVNVGTAVRLAETLRINEEFLFRVTSEKEFDGVETFFHGEPYAVLRDGIHEGVEVMVGYTADEGVFVMGSADITKILDTASRYRDSFIPKAISENCPSDTQLQVGRKIMKYYFDNDKTVDKIDALVKYYSMYIISYGIHQWAKIFSSFKRNKVFLYKFNCKSGRNLYTQIWGAHKVIGPKPVVSHCDDLCYLFPFKGISRPVDKNSDTFQVIDRVTKLWTNMAKYGNPTPDASLGVTWKPFDPEHQCYLDIGNQLSAGTFPDKDDITFWEDLCRSFAPNCVYKSHL